ncbi:hypothetical protein GcM3_209021 [Golovinomyces cichoracearum]|uniref:Uncharacterized protein n=1 Tax=Golovinomyces cichoracearum TaxID=62708 RepID=A0A420HAC8_9PEZI|nr:hypothetical protein GcM3_209021 [Golovinomyces cichoracearum]
MEYFVNFHSTSEIHDGPNNRDSYEFFNTECGEFTTIQAISLTQWLSRISAKHALTSIVQKVDLVELDGVFLIQDRYGPTSSFHGILVDSGAAGPSTADYKQYQAFVKTLGPTKLCATKQKYFKFGIGSTTSM